MVENLVSIITPCYNSERFIKRYLDSVLEQSYPHIELILINDGSVDKTEEIISLYSSKFENKNIKMKYIKQENQGLGATINVGLSIFNGEYLTWPDADDILHYNYVERKIEFLNKNKDCDLVINKIRVVNENDIDTQIDIYARKHDGLKDNMFEDLLFWNNIVTIPGAYMARSSSFLRTVGREIYPSRYGQNFQILLPITYSCKYDYLDEVLFTYVLSEHSLSSIFRSNIEKKLEHADTYEDIIIMTLQNMNMIDDKKTHYIKLVKKLYNSERKKIIQNNEND